MTAEAIAKALGGRKAGGSWTARCPAHDDRTPSLSISSHEGRGSSSGPAIRLLSDRFAMPIATAVLIAETFGMHTGAAR